MKKALSYARTSSSAADRATAAIAAQAQEIERVATAEGFAICQSYADICASAPGELQQRQIMLDRLQHEQIDAVIVTSVTRLSRDPAELRAIKRLLAAHGVLLIAAEEQTIGDVMRFFNSDAVGGR